MLRKAVVTLGALLLSSWVGAVAAVTIDFSAYPEGTAITNQFAADGVTFRGVEDNVDVPNVVANWPVSNLSNCYPTVCDSRADVIEVSFAAPADNVSLVLDSQGGESITFNTYDGGGALLETLSATGSGVTVAFSVGGISRIDMLQPDESWGWGFSDLTFDLAVAATAVPTMSAYGMALTGLGLMIVAMRRLRVRQKPH